MRRLIFFLAMSLVVSSAPALQAQQVELRGYGEADLDALLRAAIAARPLVVVRDTIIRSTDTIRSNVLVLEARFIVEGTVLGDVTGVEANMYFRPAANINGQVTNVSGGFYPSELAEIDDVEDRPLAPYHVLRDGEIYIIEGTVQRPALQYVGGFQLPEYNRVDGLRAEIGPSIVLPPFAGVEPVLSGSIGYATERKDVLWRTRLDLRRRRSSVAFGYEDNITVTNDDWIRNQLKNSVAFIWNGKDYRNYYEADRAFAEFRRTLERGQRVSGYWLRAQHEHSRPLAAGDPFVLFKPDSVRANPLVDERKIVSAFVGGDTEWNGPVSVWRVSAAVEMAGNVLGADEAFNAYRVNALYAMKAIANHTLEIETYFRGPLPGTDSLPEQRWTFVGGSGTLYTYDIAQFRGDRLAFVETEYTIPFAQRFTIPILGAPKLKLMHNAGMAWTHTEKRNFEQNVGIRLQFALAYVRYIIDPATGDGKFAANVTLPSKGYPWEKSTRPTRR